MATNALEILSLIIVVAAGIYLALLLVELRKANTRKLQEQGRRVIAIVTNVEREREERGNPEVRASITGTISKPSGPIPRRGTRTSSGVTALLLAQKNTPRERSSTF
jgi:hypothetical protein